MVAGGDEALEQLSADMLQQFPGEAGLCAVPKLRGWLKDWLAVNPQLELRLERARKPGPVPGAAAKKRTAIEEQLSAAEIAEGLRLRQESEAAEAAVKLAQQQHAERLAEEAAPVMTELQRYVSDDSGEAGMVITIGVAQRIGGLFTELERLQAEATNNASKNACYQATALKASLLLAKLAAEGEVALPEAKKYKAARTPVDSSTRAAPGAGRDGAA